MELNLSLGDTSFLEMEDLGFHLGLGSSFCGRSKETRDHSRGDREDKGKRSRDVVALQLHLFPSRSLSLLPQLNDNNGKLRGPVFSEFLLRDALRFEL